MPHRLERPGRIARIEAECGRTIFVAPGQSVNPAVASFDHRSRGTKALRSASERLQRFELPLGGCRPRGEGDPRQEKEDANGVSQGSLRVFPYNTD